MPVLISALLAAGFLACIAMNDAANTSANTIAYEYAESQDDLELAQMAGPSVNPPSQLHDVSLPSMSSEHLDTAPESSFFTDAFFPSPETRQPSYPSPDIACNSKQLPYPTLSEQKVQLTANSDPRNVPTALETSSQYDTLGAASTVNRDHTRTPSNQEHDAGPVCTDPTLGDPFTKDDTSPLSDSIDVSTEDQATELKEEDLASILHDSAVPYSIGDAVGRQEWTRRLEDRTNTLASVASAGSGALDCGDCGRAFLTRSDLRHHVIAHNEEKKRRHKCPVCQKGFRYPKDRRRHELTHGEAGHVCSQCGSQFKRLDHLERHLKGHAAGSVNGSMISRKSIVSSNKRQSFGRPSSFSRSSQGAPFTLAMQETPLHSSESVALDNPRLPVALISSVNPESIGMPHRTPSTSDFASPSK
ncbi:hypothetical protein Q7P37_005955 [Cladosporium fusiforme]